MPRRCGIGNARDSAAGWASSEINCTAGWIERRPVVEMALPVIAIRSPTDGERAQTRGASARVRVLPETRGWSSRAGLFAWQPPRFYAAEAGVSISP
jgi:hypothetical protein